MVTYKTLEVFHNKILDAMKTVKTELRSTRDHLRYLEDSNVALKAQKITLEELMDAENPQQIEIPEAGEDIEKLFEERLGKAEFPDAEEMYKQRQEGVYKREALGAVDQIDEINSEEDSELDTA